jgi:uncharacterized protein (DUF433 family)
MLLSSERFTFDAVGCGGRPCIRGLRIRATDVPDLRVAGVDEAEMPAGYPAPEPDDIGARLSLAAAEADHSVRVSPGH